jgi:hypothetical protein
VNQLKALRHQLGALVASGQVTSADVSVLRAGVVSVIESVSS